MWWMLQLALIAIVAGAGIADRWSSGFDSWWLMGVSAVSAVLGMVALTWRGVVVQPRWVGPLVGLVFGTGVVGMGVALAVTAPSRPMGSRVLFLAGASYVVLAGIWLLVRQWSWRTAITWLLPVVLPLVLGVFPGIGLVVHTFYLDAFDLRLEDIEIPVVYQVVASLKVIAAMSMWLLAPAFWGYAKHFHLAIRDRWVGHLMLLFIALCSFVAGPWMLAAEPAGEAGQRAVAAAAAGRAPAAYFGIKPEWVCVAPVGRAAETAVEGGEFQPEHPYLMLGDADGKAVLWDPKERHALKISMSKIKVVPSEGKAPAHCG
ncbi:hypothetical protein BLA24_07730 [Streptomyces cinnamoneus]|uniref:Uncharacterized protein n=1 Tax=Streptomyces cinnamoneus TaxID=53446 RepID=A0A2G1XM72_STRCJ|nr:hypothetical protein BLA24_07730 [Streptomyces cinnamoneus]PPT11541.1 hypothetical protein CYQ11_00160 [Streptomyces cinnamoneus]